MWRGGHSQSAIARLLDRTPGGIRHVLMQTGGYTPTDRQRSTRHLRSDERELISRSLASGLSIRSIAAELGRSPSTVSREINRNGATETYRAVTAEKRAWQCAERPKACKLQLNARLRRLVARKLALDWCPPAANSWLAQGNLSRES